MMSTKHKLIFVVFGLVAVVYLVIYVVEHNASNKKLERFADDDDEDDEEGFEEDEQEESNEAFEEEKKGAEKQTSKPEEKIVESPTKQVVPTPKQESRSLGDLMREVSSYLQQKLPGAKEQMAVMKELFSEDNLAKLTKLTSIKEVQHFVNEVIEGEQAPFTNIDALQTKLQSIKDKLKKAQDEIDVIYKEQSKKKEGFNERFQPAGDAPPKNVSKGVPVVEGFENVRNSYASY